MRSTILTNSDKAARLAGITQLTGKLKNSPAAALHQSILTGPPLTPATRATRTAEIMAPHHAEVAAALDAETLYFASLSDEEGHHREDERQHREHDYYRDEQLIAHAINPFAY